MNTAQLRDLNLRKEQEIRELHQAGVQERAAHLNMQAALFGSMNQLMTTIGSLSVQGRGISDLNIRLHDQHMRNLIAAEKLRQMEAHIAATSHLPAPVLPSRFPGPGVVLGSGDTEMVTEIPHTDPAADAAMDRVVQISPTRRAPSLDDHRDGLRDTAAKIRKISQPEDDRPTPYPEIRPAIAKRLAIADRQRSLPPALPPPSAPAPAVPLPTNGPNTDYKQLRDAASEAASHRSQGSAAPSYRSHRTHGSPSKNQLALIEPPKPGSRPASRPSRPQSILRAPSVEEGRTPSQFLGPSGSSRSASRVSSAVRSASAVSQNSVESGQFGRSHSAASKVSQRSSRSFRERGPWRHTPSNDSLPVLNPRPTRALSVASVGRASATSDFSQGKTADKRRRIGSGTPHRSMSASLGPARRSASTIYRDIQNRD